MGGTCPEWAESERQYLLVLEHEGKTEAPSGYFPYPIYALAHSNIAAIFEKV